MRMVNTYCRGEIYFADLSDGRGSEQQGIRPVVILQNNVGNKFSSTIIVAPLTSKISKRNFPTHVYIKNDCGNIKPSLILLEHIRTIDKSRLDNKIGELSEKYIDEVNKRLLISIGITDSSSKEEGD